MNKKIVKIFVLLLISYNPLNSVAQDKTVNDSIELTSKGLTEVFMLLQQQQFDSIEKVRLKNEIKQSTDNVAIKADLEKRLQNLQKEDSLRKLEMEFKFKNIRQNVAGVPVRPFKDTIFYVHTRIASFSPVERAKNIVNQIVKLYNDPFFNPDSLKLIQSFYGTEIIYNNDAVLMIVTEIDALFYNKKSFQLATEYRDLIKQTVLQEKQLNSLSNILIRLGKVIIVIAFVILLIYLIVRIFRKLKYYFALYRDQLLNGLGISKLRLFSPDSIENLINRFIGLLQLFVIIFTIYLSLPLLFSIFPETKIWTTTLLNWVINPARKALNAAVAFLPNLFTILVIVLLFRYLIKGVRYFVIQIEKGEIEIKGFHADWAQPTFRILKFLLYAFMLVLIFPYLPGSDSPAFKGVSVFLGILFSLGSSSAIANMVAGMVITYMRPFRIGDRVKIGDVTGDIIEKTLLVTRIRTVKNEDVTVPNSSVLSSSTINYTTYTKIPGSGLIIHSTVTIGYDAPWEAVHKALLEAAYRTELILKAPPPFVLQTSLDDFYVSYQINGYILEANNQAKIYSQLHQHIQNSFNEAGIEIMSPHYRSQRDGNTITIPSAYLDNDYKAPAFRVTTENEGN